MFLVDCVLINLNVILQVFRMVLKSLSRPPAYTVAVPWIIHGKTLALKFSFQIVLSLLKLMNVKYTLQLQSLGSSSSQKILSSLVASIGLQVPTTLQNPSLLKFNTVLEYRSIHNNYLNLHTLPPVKVPLIVLSSVMKENSLLTVNTAA